MLKGDLGAIDEKYDIAISTACGSLDCIVVDTVDTATKCIEYLKKHNIGSASFLALDKQEKWREHLKKQFNSPENVPRLVDLIKVNNEDLLTAFYYSLRNTLVADNLEQASRIAYGQQRNRVVTLKGEIIEVSGTMSGGGRPMKGRMGRKIVEDISADSIKDMQTVLQQDENELKQLIQRKQLIEPKQYEIKTKLEKSKENLHKWKNEINSIKEQISTLTKGEIECKKKLKELVPDETKLEQLEKNLEKFKKQYEKADNVAAQVRQEIDKLHENIMNTNKRILDKPKKNLENLDNEIKEMNNQVTSLNVEIKSVQRNLTNSKKKLNSLNEDLEQNQQKEKDNLKRLDEMDDEGKMLIEEHENVKDELEKLERELSEKTKLIKDLEKDKQKYEKLKIDLNHKMEKLYETLQIHEKQLKHYKNLLESLKLHNLDLENNRNFMNDIDVNSGENITDNDENNEQLKLKKYSNDELDDIDFDNLKSEIHDLDAKLKSMTPNLSAIQSYLELVGVFFLFLGG